MRSRIAWKIGIALLAFVVVLAILPAVVSAAPITWQQSRFGVFVNFNGCFDDPNNPNPIQSKNMPVNFTNNSQAGGTIFVLVGATGNVSLGGCVPIVSPFISSVSDNFANSYSRVGTFQPNQTAICNGCAWELWAASNVAAGTNALTIFMGSGKLQVEAIIYEFTGVVAFEYQNLTSNNVTNAGDIAFKTTWNSTNQQFLFHSLTPNGGACAVTPPCVYPATTEDAGTGGYNDNQIGIACPIAPCNNNANGRPGGGDNHTLVSGTTFRLQTARITSNTTGSHTWYQRTSAGTWNFAAFGLLLTNQIFPIVSTLPATGIDSTRATLNGNLTDLGLGPTINVFFDWGDTPNLGNRTANQSATVPSTFAAILYSLNQNTTYFFRAHAENPANTSIFATGSILNFTTLDPIRDLRNVALPFIFFALMFTGLYLAWVVSKRRGRFE
jgi:hypothetical protein